MKYKNVNLLGPVTIIALLVAIELRAVQQISIPQASPEGVFTTEPTAVLVTAQVSVDAALLPTSVNLVRKNASGQTTTLGQMYDDGTHGDALVGDGTFSIRIPLNETATGNVSIAATAAYRGQRNRVSSPTASIAVAKRPTDTEVKIASDVPTDGQKFFELRRLQVGDDQARAELLTALTTEPGVQAAGLSDDGFFIWITFASGLHGGIILAPVGTQGTISFVGGSKNIALAPYFDSFSPFDATDNVANSLGQTCGGLPSVLKNTQGTVDAFKSMSGAGAVYINTHGVLNGNNEVLILTSEPVTLSTRIAHFSDWTLFGRIENWGGYWALRPTFISAYCSFPDSIIFAGLCDSAANRTMADAFLSKGAKTYFGYSKIVWTDFNFATSTALFDFLTDPSKQLEDKTAQKAFDSIAKKTDPGTPHAVFTMFGDGNVALRSELVVNGRFEVGNLIGWTSSGPGYTKAVTEDKSEGAYSARLGRWDQLYTYSGGFRGPAVPGLEPLGTDAIYQDVTLPDAPSLPFQFDYNVVTFDGADYDFLDVYVTDVATGTTLAHPVNGVGGIIAGSPSNWGLFYTTGWQHVSIDLAAFKGKTVRITFAVTQDGYGDQCAAYLDNVSIRCSQPPPVLE